MEVFVARQPIFDKKLEVVGYELLFRTGFENVYGGTDGDQASSSVITDSFLVIGLDTLTRGKKAFINFTEKLLLDETAMVLPKEILIIEILENIEPTEEIIAACKNLKKSGYHFALDDFVFEKKFIPLIELADIIKVDLKLSDMQESRAIIQNYCSGKNIKFLAEKLETHEEFEQALQEGYSYFQGFFFSKPVIISRKEIPGSKINSIQIISEISRPDVDFSKLETLFKHDISLSFKLLKFINSAFFSFSSQINSLRQALTLLGVNEIKKWVSLIILKGLGSDKPEELIITSIVRARVCELIAEQTWLKNQSSELFLMGMFSTIDTFMNRPMDEILEELPLSDNIKDALLNGEGPFSNIFNLVLVYEKSEWDKVSEYAEVLNIDQSKIPELYIKSLEWTNQLFDQLSVSS